MSANDWHSHAAQVRPLHPVTVPVAGTEALGALAAGGLGAELAALTRVLLGPAQPAAPAAVAAAPIALDANPGLASLTPPAADFSAAQPAAPTAHAAMSLPDLPDLDLPPVQPQPGLSEPALALVAMPEVTPLVQPAPAAQPAAPVAAPAQGFNVPPIVEIEPLVPDLPQLPPAVAPKASNVVLDDLAFLDS
ncbi:hypothetical protein [Nocardioides sp. GXZ039]|uniref:hypothetical protein n=1 Tax=Nocardioides sp. GXZ039 TaxID=3136018 RepID=UPI0030F3CB3C